LAVACDVGKKLGRRTWTDELRVNALPQTCSRRSGSRDTRRPRTAGPRDSAQAIGDPSEFARMATVLKTRHTDEAIAFATKHAETARQGEGDPPHGYIRADFRRRRDATFEVSRRGKPQSQAAVRIPQARRKFQKHAVIILKARYRASLKSWLRRLHIGFHFGIAIRKFSRRSKRRFSITSTIVPGLASPVLHVTVRV
jgi:hypothetical protein